MRERREYSNRCVLATALAALALATPASARGQTVFGHVLDSLSGHPLPTTAVMLLDSAGTKLRYTLTDSMGRFVLKAPRWGRYQVYVDQPSYRAFMSDTIDLTEHRKLELLLRLVPTPLLLDRMSVTVRREEAELKRVGFYRRQPVSFGYLFGPEQVRDERPFVVTDLLRQVPGVVLKPTDGIGNLVVARVPGTFPMMDSSWNDSPGCLMKVVLDGTSVHQDAGMTIDDMIPVQEVLAIEAYPFHGMGAPVRYRGLDSGCGVVLIWTKRR